VDSYGETVADEDLLGVLRVPYRKTVNGGYDLDIKGDRLSVIDLFIDPGRWQEICGTAREAAERHLRSRDVYRQAVAESHKRGTQEWIERLDTLQVRLNYSIGKREIELLHTRDLNRERDIGRAILEGVQNPHIRVDSAGFIVVSGRDCPAAGVG
jgi:ATP-dependent helicase HepA